MSKVGIVIVTFNSKSDISRLLNSILAQSYSDFRVYIIDNNSHDGTIDLAGKFVEKINLVLEVSKTNNGYAKGNNLGIKKALLDGCEFVFILNPDMELDKNCLWFLVQKMKSDNSIGVIGPIVLYGDRQEIIQGYGVIADFKTQKKINLYGDQKLIKEIPDENIVSYVHGGAMLIRSEVFAKSGLFEESYFMYNDELDISRRILDYGYKIICIRSSKVFHFHNFSNLNIKGFNLLYYYGIRNKYLYFKKYQLYLNLIFALIFDIVSLPIKIKSFAKSGSIKITKYYYLGLLRGLLGETGFSSRRFE